MFLRFKFLVKFLLIIPLAIISKEVVSSTTNNFKDARIVALTSLSADLVNQINNKNLVGITGSSLLNKDDDFKNIPVVSSGRMQPDIEKIINLKPTLVIGASGFHDKTLMKINNLGIETISTEIKDIESLNNLYNLLLTKIDIENAKDLDEVINNCFITKKNINNQQKNLVALVSVKPTLSPGASSWAGSLIKRFNLNNLSDNLQVKSQYKGYANLSLEWLLKARPNNLIIINTPGSSISQYQSLSIWEKIPAVKKNKVFEFEYYGLINPGNLDSINKACKKLSLI